MTPNSNPHGGFKPGSHGVLNGILVHGNVSGWYARLDRVLDDREAQIDAWLSSWERSLQQNLPIAAFLPETWPTLPANLITDPGYVLDHLLARHDAELDGRSPRGAQPIPTILSDSMVTSELLDVPNQSGSNGPMQMTNLDALPPGFRAQIERFRLNGEDDVAGKRKERIHADVESGLRTWSGIPLPVADPSCGGGHFLARLLRRHAENTEGMDPRTRLEDTTRLLKGIQGLDIHPTMVDAARRRLLLEAERYGLLNSDLGLTPERVRSILNESIRCADALQESWPWIEAPRVMFCNPPWLRIKDRFRGHPDGSTLRRSLSEALRTVENPDGGKRFSTLRGNVNLYRLFIERGLQVLREGGSMRAIAPDSVLREQSSTPLRQLIVENHQWNAVWCFEEGNQLFPGLSQGVVMLHIEAGGETDELLVRGPLVRADLRRHTGGLVSSAPALHLDRSRWHRLTRGSWAVPRLPRDPYDRSSHLEKLEALASRPRLSDEIPFEGMGESIRVRVGEVDQNSNAKDIKAWTRNSKGQPFIRGAHFSENDHGAIRIRHPAYVTDIPSRGPERQSSLWVGDGRIHASPRLACQATIASQQERRLMWAIIPVDAVLGNTVNHVELPPMLQATLARAHGSLERGLEALLNELNDPDLDLWSCAWASNNNLNNYEIEMLPLDVSALLHPDPARMQPEVS